jgi:hypothetical protein
MTVDGWMERGWLAMWVLGNQKIIMKRFTKEDEGKPPATGSHLYAVTVNID